MQNDERNIFRRILFRIDVLSTAMFMIVAILVGLSTLLSQFMRRHSIYTLKLARRGIPLERGRDVDVMRGVTVGKVMTRDPDTVPIDMSLRELAKVFTRTHHHATPLPQTKPWRATFPLRRWRCIPE